MLIENELLCKPGATGFFCENPRPVDILLLDYVGNATQLSCISCPGSCGNSIGELAAGDDSVIGCIYKSVVRHKWRRYRNKSALEAK